MKTTANLLSVALFGMLVTGCGAEPLGIQTGAEERFSRPLFATQPAGPVTMQAAGYNFVLDPPNTAEDPATGEVIQVNGAGQFNGTGGTVRATGHFTHFSSTGEVLARGTWRATDFVGFESFGGPSPGIQGGILDITVTLFPIGGAPVTGLAMRVVCTVNAPPDSPEEGTTLGVFTEPTGGFTVFNFQQGR